ncbi:hypothetical protein IRJ41_009992 [Triplophysa rosa]|uniref:Uncharacterized protein n=1 Tax=Triplophysa rosa TaxID=992332 RepID=A0A9W7WNL0_TRIRA|nr:hypothetical protein IRJ41_009992 [Triplophysa rosa]
MAEKGAAEGHIRGAPATIDMDAHESDWINLLSFSVFSGFSWQSALLSIGKGQYEEVELRSILLGVLPPRGTCHRSCPDMFAWESDVDAYPLLLKGSLRAQHACTGDKGLEDAHLEAQPVFELQLDDILHSFFITS